jgi:asparagine synthase (glutamine-hydrolysing)
MCGIAGAYAWSASSLAIDREEMRRVRERMAARGPDGVGEWFSDDGRVALMHRRLAIIDLSESGLQPMHSADGRYAIVFNGEIYNYRELRDELIRDGVNFVSNSDTEVLLALYAQRGEAMLTALRGMFAFAVWDKTARSLFMARDTFGIKPFYYTVEAGRVRFASQVKALLQSDVDRSPSNAGSLGFYLWGSVPEPHTLYRNIRALPAGHWLRIESNGQSTLREFESVKRLVETAAETRITISRDESLEAIAEAVRDSVRAHQVADVPVGLFLSAGLDSSMLADVSTREGYNTQSITVGFSEYVGTANDEVPLAESVARLVGTQHRTAIIGREAFEQDRDALFEAMDQPSIDGVNTWFVARAAKEAGLKVALSGSGGDELFGSYPSFRDVPRMQRFARAFAHTPALGRAARKTLSTLLPSSVSPKYAGIPEYGATAHGAYFLRRGLFMPWELRDAFTAHEVQSALGELDFPHALAQYTPNVASSHAIVSALETSLYMRNQLLRDADWAGMAHSLEIRVPFVDKKLLTSVMPYLIRHLSIKKADIARGTGKHLTPDLIGRPKTGFTVPVREWLQGDTQGAEASGNSDRGLRGWAKNVLGRFQ